MKTTILSTITILLATTNIFAYTPSRYSSRTVRGSDGRTIGREVEKSYGSVKHHEFYNNSGKKVQSTRQSINPYSRSPTTGGYKK